MLKKTPPKWPNICAKTEAMSGGILYNAQLRQDYETLYKITKVDIPAETIMTGDSKNDSGGVWNYILAAARHRNNISVRHFKD